MSGKKWIIKKLWYIHKMQFSSIEIKWTTNICKNIDAFLKYYDEWKNPDTKVQFCDSRTTIL